MAKQAKQQISKKLTTSLAFRIAEDEKQSFIEYCEKVDLSTSQCVRRAIKEYMKNHPIEEERI